MRIGLIIFSDGWGGAENVVHSLARAFKEKNEDVFLIINQEITRYYRDLPGVRTYDVGPLYSPRRMLGSLLRLNAPSADLVEGVAPMPYVWNALRAARRWAIRTAVARILVEERADIVSLHLEEAFSLYPACIEPLNIPTVVTLHSPLLGVPRKSSLDPLKERRRRSLTSVMNGVEGITYQSACEMESLRSLPKPPRCRPAAIPNGVHVDEMRRQAGVALRGDGRKIVYMGGSRWQKGGELAVRTMSLLRDLDGLEMHMLGKIPEGHGIRIMAKELELDDRITFHGFVPSPDVFSYLNSAHIVLIPSLSEGFSVTAIEAMALGKPIVGTNVGGIPTAVRDGRNAVLVEPDPYELANAIRQLLREPDRMNAMSEVNWDDAARYDWGLVSQMYIDYFDGIVSRCSGPAPWFDGRSRRSPTRAAERACDRDHH